MFFEVGVDGIVGSYIVGKVVISSEVGIEAREELLEASFNRLTLCLPCLHCSVMGWFAHQFVHLRCPISQFASIYSHSNCTPKINQFG